MVTSHFLCAEINTTKMNTAANHKYVVYNFKNKILI